MARRKETSDAALMGAEILAKPLASADASEREAKIRARIQGEDYQASPTIARFQESAAFVRMIRGPVGGGKTTAACVEIMRRAREQAPNAEGIRRTRWCVVRNTYGMLKDTSAKTWLEWFPEDLFGKFLRTAGDMRHHIKHGDIDCEVLFRALDTPEDTKKVLSLELTGAFINEVREVPKAIIDALTDRVGRFPPVREGGATWRGIIADTNPPDEDHWYHGLEAAPPEDWEFFVQPGGLIRQNDRWVPNPAAENIANLEPSYYRTRSAGKREDYVKVYYGNQFGFVSEGKPVWPEYADAVHAAKGEIAFTSELPVYIGIGIALQSAALFAQRRANGQWVMLDELQPDYGGAVHFAQELASKMARDFPLGTKFKVYALRPDDPYGAEAEALQILRGRGIAPLPCRVSDAVLRREAVAGALSRLLGGDPGLLVSARCRTIRKALAGGYAYPLIQGQERYHDKPAENRYAPIAEALQYMLVGGGEHQYVFASPKPKKLAYQPLGIV